MKEIPLTQGKVALIDDEDYYRVNQYRWFAWKRSNTWYARHVQRRGKEKRTIIDMHRLIMGFPEHTVDHIDGNGLNNTRNNLRNATIAQNIKNARKRSDSKQPYKGIEWDKVNLNWHAYICPKGKKTNLGRFATAEAAAHAYDTAAIRLYGEFAHLNFP